MQNPMVAAPIRPALIAYVDRALMKVGITDDRCRLRPDTVRSFDAAAEPTVSGVITTMMRDHDLAGAPVRLALSIAGSPRGDTVSVTHGRWRVSRPGLAAMLRHEPLILNECAAGSWAIGHETTASMQPIAGGVLDPTRPGTYCVVSVGRGLGVSLLHRDHHGHVTVLPTEAGHCSFPTGLAAAAPAIAALEQRQGLVTAETILSAKGLVTLHHSALPARNAASVGDDPREIIRLALAGADTRAAQTLDVFAAALWHFAGTMVLAHGAFDGVILTGDVARTLSKMLSRPAALDQFVKRGPFQRQLAAVPRAFSSLADAELNGAAAALASEIARGA